MKTNQSLYSALFIGCLLAAAPSCSNEDDNLPKEKTPVGITATLTGEVETKADAEYKPAANTTIFMYYKNGANTETDEKGYYTYTSSTWTSTNQDTNANHCIFWDDLVPVDSKYPFFAVSPTDTNNALSGAVETDQSTDKNFINSDLLMAYTAVEGTSKMTNVPLTFKHMLSKLTIKVKVGAISSFNSSAVTIQNAKKDYTINYTSPTPTAAVPAAVAASGTANVTITPHAESDETDTGKTVKVYSAILPAQTISKIQTVVTVESVGSTTTYTYTYTGSVTLAQATNTTLTLTINGTKVELDNIKVTNWTQKTVDGDITIDNP